jgi:hypothetical protein
VINLHKTKCTHENLSKTNINFDPTISNCDTVPQFYKTLLMGETDEGYTGPLLILIIAYASIII